MVYYVPHENCDVDAINGLDKNDIYLCSHIKSNDDAQVGHKTK